MSTWSGLTAVVTGASSGIGEEIAVQLTRAGARVVIAARRLEELERVAARCRGETPGADVFAMVADVSVQSQCASLIADSVKRLGKLDVLVNNAGQGMWSRADEMADLSVYETMLRVNYLSVVWVTLAALPHLKVTRGRILGVGSLSGKTGVPLRSGYAAAKHAMTGFLDTLRIELKDDGVSVTMIHPGFVATGSQARNLGADGRALGKMPLKPGDGLKPDECARLLLDAGAARRRDVLPGLRAKVAMWLKLMVPDFVDGMTAKAIKGKR